MPVETNLMTVIILGDEQDIHAQHVRHALAARNVDALFLDSRWFPGRLSLTRFASPDDDRLRLADGRVVSLSDVRAVYWRNYNSVGTPQLPNEEQSYIAYNDSRSLFESMLQRSGPLWVNGWEGYQLHQWKPEAMRRVGRLGVRTPRTIWTNDSHDLQSFLDACPSAIFKPVQGGAPTRRLERGRLSPDQRARLAIAPVTVQEEIPGTNIRAFVAGERVLACEVLTGEVDFREDAQPKLLPHAVPDAVAQSSVRIAAALALVWTGIDYRLTPEGEYVFLEANPSPMFLGFETATGLPLTDALCQLLTGQ